VIRGLHENLVWTRSGFCWAVYRIEPDSYPNAPIKRRRELLDARAAALKTLPEQVLALSLVATTDPADTVRSVIAGVDLDACPSWAEVAETTLDLLDSAPPQQRTEWICVPLDSRASARGLLKDAAGVLDQMFGTLPAPISVAAVVAAKDRAAKLIKATAGSVTLRAATAAEVVWIFEHAVHRGAADPVLAAPPDRAHPEPDPGGPAPRMGHLGAAQLFDGGSGPARRRSPYQRRWLEVVDPDGAQSWQAFLVLAEAPPAFAWPGSELLARMDEWFSFPVDVACNIRTVPGKTAKIKVTRKLNELRDQSDQLEPEGSEAVDEAQQGAIALARGDLRDYGVELSGSSAVEVQPVVVLCVWGPDQRTCEQRADDVRSFFAGEDWLFVRPGGGQDQLWLAMLPDRPAPPVLGEYRQYLGARPFAMWMPWVSNQVGDPQGGLFAVRARTSLNEVVLVDPSWGPTADASGAVGVAGELGSGKSYSGKKLMGDNADRRGLNLVIDRTESREWVRFARACSGRTSVIDVDDNAGVSLDPLRVMTGLHAVRLAETFLTLLLAVPPMEPEGVAVSEAVHAVASTPHPTMAAVVDELERRGAGPGGNPDARLAAGKLRMAARKDIAQVVFNPDLPVLDLHSADNIVFCAADLVLPTQQELESEYRARRIEFTKLFGRAALFLIAAIIKERAFSSPRFAFIVLDECWYLATSPEGEALLVELVRDGRKHGTSPWLAAQNAEAFPAVAAGLLGTRIVMRTRNRELAQAALRFIGADPDNEDLIEMLRDFSPVTNDPDERNRRAGEALLRDTRGRISPVKILPHMRSGLGDAASTTATYSGDADSPPPAPTAAATATVEVPGGTLDQAPAGPGSTAASAASTTLVASAGKTVRRQAPPRQDTTGTTPAAGAGTPTKPRAPRRAPPRPMTVPAADPAAARSRRSPAARSTTAARSAPASAVDPAAPALVPSGAST